MSQLPLITSNLSDLASHWKSILDPTIAQVALNAASIIGEVKMSPLTEVQFQAQAGNNWVLMNGRNVATSQYAKITGKFVLPPANVTVPNMNFFIRIN